MSSFLEILKEKENRKTIGLWLMGVGGVVTMATSIYSAYASQRKKKKTGRSPPPIQTSPTTPPTRRSNLIDFRSDTVTKPTPQMLKYIQNCDFGDDVMQEDPTVRALEQKVAKMFGKEAGLFVCSGTMSNQLACRVHLDKPTHQVICDFAAHIYQYELGGVSFHTGCSYRTIKPANGKYITLEEVKKNVCLKNDWHHSMTRLVALENTASGMVLPIEEIAKISKYARKNGLRIHLDGARIWNASIASGVTLLEYGKHFDTVSACLSKGLGAPVGTVLVGTQEMIDTARRFRKIFGGGWRQAGVIAGMALFALETNLEKLKVDHKNAKFLAKELQKLGFVMEKPVETNMLFTSSHNVKRSWKYIEDRLNGKNILIKTRGDDNFVRIVVHVQTSLIDLKSFLYEVKQILQ